jgi:hypothetical protein
MSVRFWMEMVLTSYNRHEDAIILRRSAPPNACTVWDFEDLLCQMMVRHYQVQKKHGLFGSGGLLTVLLLLLLLQCFPIMFLPIDIWISFHPNTRFE